MGQRFIVKRYHLSEYSEKRALLRLNEGDYEPRRMRPYGLSSGKFAYRQLFEKKSQSRLGNRNANRANKKSVRQRAITEDTN